MALLINRYTLTLCPGRVPYGLNGPVEHLAGTRIELEPEEQLFAAIGPHAESLEWRRCQPKSLPSNVTYIHLDDEGLHERTCDARGNRLTYVTAGELSALSALAREGGGLWNAAAFAFIAALPGNVPVVLYWG